MKKGVFGIAGLVVVMALGPVLGAVQATQTAQAPPPAVAPLSPAFAPKPYTFAAGDTIRLDFYGLSDSDLDMKKVYLVEADGTITLKYSGPVRVHGLTAPEVAEAVKKSLEPKFYPPDIIQVTAMVAEERVQRVQVGGQVISPGEKALRGNQMTVSRAIAQANGFTPNAGEEIEIKRTVDGKTEITVITRAQLTGGDDPPLIDDDQITVKTGHVFYIAGEINSPGTKVWSPGMTVGKAISMSGGMTTKGKLGYISRPIKGPDGKVIKYEDVKKLKPETELLPDDTLHIARKWFG